MTQRTIAEMATRSGHVVQITNRPLDHPISGAPSRRFQVASYMTTALLLSLNAKLICRST
jgi:hypothetical protein